MSTAFLTHNDCALHEMGSWHPECPARLSAISDQLIANGLMDYLVHVAPDPATRQAILRVHTQHYLESLEASAPEQGYAALDPDTLANPHTLKAAFRAAGAAVKAVDLVMGQAVDNAFCAVRPPGHHARMDAAMGFCIFNNVAIAAKHALEVHKLKRVAIIDFDVHHGNGTEEVFADDPRVLMCGFFQHPYYPFSGARALGANMINVPVAAGSNGEVVRELVERHWLPQLESFKPEFVFISAGFDAHREDDLADMRLVEADYAWITAQLMAVAKEFALGRVVSTLEGGYNLSALARSVVAHLRVLSDV